MITIGELGEQLVSQWLETQGWIILHHQWRCRWGEIDLIARSRLVEALAFVEVKTRSRNNWDNDGIFSITHQKQGKLCRTASLFLVKYPNFADFICRFDVALVSYKKIMSFPTDRLDDHHSDSVIKIGKPISHEGYQLTLKRYIESAFDQV
jgi:putative endonuclease